MKKKITKVIITGAFGRMGKMLTQEIKKNKYIELTYSLVHDSDLQHKQQDNNKFFTNHREKFITLNQLKNEKYIPNKNHLSKLVFLIF